MSIRSNKIQSTPNSVDLGYEGNDIPDDFIMPSCTIEDADRAVFSLFDSQLPMQYMHHGETKKIPVIFATGERFAVLNRQQPLRDKNKTLILPLISIMRTGLTQTPDNGLYTGEMHTTVIKKRISQDSDLYKRLVNKVNLMNQKNIAHKSHDGEGTVFSRRDSSAIDYDILDGKLLTPDLDNNIYEIISIPPVKHYQSTYSVTFWAQYIQQANNMISAVMSMYQNNYGRTFKLETPKGYWFVGYVASDFQMDNNLDDFTDTERIIKTTFDIKVNAYLITPDYPGAPNGVRRVISAPTIEFTAASMESQQIVNLNASIQSNDPSAYVLNDIATDNAQLPGQAISVDNQSSDLKRIGIDTTNASVLNTGNVQSVSIGGHSPQSSDTRYERIEVDPFTGKKRRMVVRVKNSKNRMGETVFKEGLEIDLGDL